MAANAAQNLFDKQKVRIQKSLNGGDRTDVWWKVAKTLVAYAAVVYFSFSPLWNILRPNPTNQDVDSNFRSLFPSIRLDQQFVTQFYSVSK